MQNLESLIAMIISEILIIVMYVIIRRTNRKNNLQKAFNLMLLLMFIWTLGSILQILFQDVPEIDPTFFEKIACIGVHFSPVVFLAMAVIFAKTKVTIKWYHFLLLVIPCLSTIIMFTNDFHHLMFEKYSIYSDQMVYGSYFPIHSIYTYSLFGIGLLYFLRYSIKNSGFFSKQSILIIIGTLIPLISNVLGMLNILPLTTYITPISFTFMVIIYAFAIFKFDFMKVTPIALQKIVDRISDGYMILNAHNMITDFNQTFLNMFNLIPTEVRGKNLFELKDKNSGNCYFSEQDEVFVKNSIKATKETDETISFDKKVENANIYFHIEISSIKDKDNFLGILVLFKDTTQHMLDMQTIKNNQNILMERERLASLGQLIGGIAHNLKTPIMSIAGASEGLTDLVKEYEASVGDPEVTIEDHHAIAKDMKDWIEKIKSYTEYMSDVITAVKGQAVTLSEEQAVSFTLDELVKRVNILMRHELKNALVNLTIAMQIDEHTVLKGNINSLVQVINNMISNAIQAYQGEPNKEIKLILADSGKNITISVQDFADGLPEEVHQKLFKEMITTKGKNGTGLGLFMSYSTIRAHFNGNITYETTKGKGTIFHIILPK